MKLLVTCVFAGSMLTSLCIAATTPDSPEPDSPVISQCALLNGVKLAYQVAGTGVPVIFIHGEGYSHELWSRQAEAFPQKYLFVSYDRRGHGLSDDPLTGYSVIAHTQDLNALMSYLGIENAHLVVHSRGGAIAIQFLRLYPDKVRSIVFADATIPLVKISDDSAFRSAGRRLKAPPPTHEEAKKRREKAKSSSFTKVAQSRSTTNAILTRMIDQYSLRVAMNPQRADMASAMDLGPWNASDFPDMSKIHQPVLLLVGELTDVFFIEGAKEAHRLWPNTQYSVLSDTDHLLMLEDPDSFNKIVLDFLAGAESQIAGRKAILED